MSDERDWLEVTLDAGTRHGLAKAVERQGGDEAAPHLLRMLRAPRDELLLDREQARALLRALETERGLSALRARLEAFLGLRS